MALRDLAPVTIVDPRTRSGHGCCVLCIVQDHEIRWMAIRLVEKVECLLVGTGLARQDIRHFD
jgi:hypothetical protein